MKHSIIALLGLLTSLSAQDGGKVIYQTYCMACHGANGEGRKGAAPALAQSSWVNGDPNIITKLLLHGVQGPIKMHGESFELVMPAQSMLNDQQIAEVASYVRNQWGNKAQPITPKFVEETREKTKSQSGVINSMHFTRPYDLKDYTLKVDSLLSAAYPFTTDFDSLKDQTPEAIEEEKGNLISPLQAGSEKTSFTAKWTGTLKIKKEGEYHFSYGTDNAARISVDDKVILERSKGTPPSVGSIKLPKGEVEISIYYAHEANTPIFFRLFLSGPDMNMHRMHDMGKRKPTPPITINPTAERALIHRNFLVKGGERTLAVGLPQDVNLYFSTDYMRLSKVWKGEFLDVGATWNGRAKGKIAKPLGKPLPVIEKGAAFKAYRSKPSSWSDDSAQPVKQQFKGYIFDKEGNPTLHYTIGGYEFSDHFSASKDNQTLTRKITIKRGAKPASGLHWKLIENAAKDSSSTFTTDKGVQLKISATSLNPFLLEKDLVLPITQPATITLEYVWK